MARADVRSPTCHAGAMPKSTPTSSAADAQNITTRPSKVTATEAGSTPAGITDGAAARMAEPMPAPRTPPSRRQDQALGEQLPRDPSAAGTERRANRQFAAAGRGPRQQQVGDVGAADEQHEADHAQEQHRGHAQVAADDGLAHRHHFHAATTVLGHRARQFRGHGRHLGAGAGDGRAGGDPPDPTEEVGRAQLRVGTDADEGPDAVVLGPAESCRRHAHHAVRLAVQHQVLADDRRVGIEARPPVGFGEDDGVVLDPVVGRLEQPPDERRRPRAPRRSPTTPTAVAPSRPNRPRRASPCRRRRW